MLAIIESAKTLTTCASVARCEPGAEVEQSEELPRLYMW